MAGGASLRAGGRAQPWSARLPRWRNQGGARDEGGRGRGDRLGVRRACRFATASGGGAATRPIMRRRGGGQAGGLSRGDGGAPREAAGLHCHAEALHYAEGLFVTTARNS